ncbi:DUF7010 family protein [Metabacillus halosaccharovorans]|uniref:DUF7010 family protein n=1 Tax=Metabacillus halosaccharovorans TaxID=930124 RepID=UPI003734FB24
MDLLSMKNDLSIKSKNGISFLLAGTIVWGIITILFLQSFEISMKNIFALYSTGLMFPLSVILSKIMNVDWKAKGNQLGNLGLILNVAQFIYFPLIFWAMISNPDEMIVYFAIITSSHFFPYGWVYHSKVYYILSPIMVLVVFIIGLLLKDEYMWVIPFTMFISLIMLSVFLFIDYKKKLMISSKKMKDYNVS